MGALISTVSTPTFSCCELSSTLATTGRQNKTSDMRCQQVEKLPIWTERLQGLSNCSDSASASCIGHTFVPAATRYLPSIEEHYEEEMGGC